MLAQHALGVVQEALHRRMQEGIEQAAPGTARVVAVVRELVRIQDRHGAEQMPRIAQQRQALDPALVLIQLVAAEADHQAVGAARHQLVDDADHRAFERLVVLRQVELRDAVSNQRLQQFAFIVITHQPVAILAFAHDQAQPRPLALHHRVGALRRRVADVVDVLQQRSEVRLAVDTRGDLAQHFDEALRQVVRRGQGFGVEDFGAGDYAGVGERATVVDADQQSHVRSSRAVV